MIRGIVNGVFQRLTNFIPLTKGMPNLSYMEKQRRELLLYKKGT